MNITKIVELVNMMDNMNTKIIEMKSEIEEMKSEREDEIKKLKCEIDTYFHPQKEKKYALKLALLESPYALQKKIYLLLIQDNLIEVVAKDDNDYIPPHGNFVNFKKLIRLGTDGVVGAIFEGIEVSLSTPDITKYVEKLNEIAIIFGKKRFVDLVYIDKILYPLIKERGEKLHKEPDWSNILFQMQEVKQNSTSEELKKEVLEREQVVTWITKLSF